MYAGVRPAPATEATNVVQLLSRKLIITNTWAQRKKTTDSWKTRTADLSNDNARKLTHEPEVVAVDGIQTHIGAEQIDAFQRTSKDASVVCRGRMVGKS